MHEAFKFDLILTDYRDSVLINMTLISVQANQISILMKEKPRGGLWVSTEAKVTGIERDSTFSSSLPVPLLLARVTGNQYKLSVRVTQGTEPNIVLFGSYVAESFRAFVSVKDRIYVCS